MSKKKQILQVAAIGVMLIATVSALYWFNLSSNQNLRAESPSEKYTGQTLINFAKLASGTSKANLAKIEDVNPDQVLKLLESIDIQDYAIDEAGCQRNPDSQYLFGAAQVEGRFVPGGGKQSLITLEVGMCGELRFNAQSHAFLVANGKVEKQFEACMNNAMLIDTPGEESLQDVLLICDWFHMGVVGNHATIFGFRNKQFDAVLQLQGYEDNCSALGKDGEIVWSILKKGKVLGQYLEDVDRASCK